MKELIKDLKRIEEESQTKLNDCISSYLKEDDFTKVNTHTETLRIFNNRYNDIKEINEIVRAHIKTTKMLLDYKKTKKQTSMMNIYRHSSGNLIAIFIKAATLRVY